jgi:single-strand DNA-binding protein
MYLNKTLLCGNLTRDPEVKALPNGNKICEFSLATNRVYKDAQGNKQEEVQFHNIVIFGKQAETSGQYLKKGQQVLIEGRVSTRSWEDKTSGEKKYRTEIIAESVQFGKRLDGESRATATSSTGGDEITQDVEPAGINPDDIPF